MTYDPNASRDRLERRGGISGGAMAGIALVMALFIGIIAWAMNSNDRTASTSDRPSTTTGQSTQPNAPANPPARAPATVPQSK